MQLPCEKMIIAVLSGDDEAEVVRDLTENGYYVTVLNSTGGFLKRKSVTLMIGVTKDLLPAAIELLKQHGGVRSETAFIPMPVESGLPPQPVNVQVGGIVVFVLDVDACEKF